MGEATQGAAQASAAGREIGAEGDEAAMREIEHVHQAEDEGEPGRHQEQHHSHGDAGDGQGDPAAAAHEGKRDKRDDGHEEIGRGFRGAPGEGAGHLALTLPRLRRGSLPLPQCGRGACAGFGLPIKKSLSLGARDSTATS